MSIRNTLAAAERRKKPSLPEGFIGEVALSSFITQDTLENLAGFSPYGIGVNRVNGGSNAWLHFNVGGKELYIAKKPMRNNVTINQLSSIGVINGTKIITINGKQYKVRLLTGTDNIAVPTNVGGGEWNSLLTRTHKDFDAAPRWASYTSEQLGMTGLTGTGGACLCQGRYANSPGGPDLGMVLRGYPHVVTGIWYAPDPNYTNTSYGWRPVLERI